MATYINKPGHKDWEVKVGEAFELASTWQTRSSPNATPLPKDITGYEFKCDYKVNLSDSAPLFSASFSLTDAPTGKFTQTVSADTIKTAATQAKRVIYDLWATPLGGQPICLEEGSLEFVPQITNI